MAPRRTEHPVDAAKLRPRPAREGTISRSSLVERLRPVALPTVATIAAPAGYGKTALLTEVAARAGHPIAWVTVDEADDDPVVFLSAVATALEAVGLDPAVRAGLGRPRASFPAALTRLGRSLRTLEPVDIAIDDLHHLASEGSRAVVATLAASLPARSLLLLAGRRRIEIRKAGRLLELGIDDLRMSEAEASLLLHGAGVTAGADEVAALTARTEGWPAGLYLAALVNQTEGQPLAEFTGSDRFVTDYFGAECLAELGEDDIGFLARASVLDTVSGPICDSVLESPRSAARLERLAGSLLFIQPLDAAGPVSYRFQSMFREALRAELRQGEPGLDQVLAARASGWCEEHGDPERAVSYAWAARDRERFATLVEEWAMTLSHGGSLATIARWLAWPDEPLLLRHPVLAVWGSLIATFRGQKDDALRWLEIAEQSHVEAAGAQGSPSLRPLIAIVRATMCPSSLDEMAADAAIAVDALADDNPWRPLALLLLGTSRLLAGDAAQADEVLTEAHRAAAVAGAPETVSLALAERSLLEASEGRWDTAEALATMARATLQDSHLDDYATGALTYATSARSAVRHNDWVRARTDLERATAFLPRLTAAAPWLAVQVRLEIARTQLELSDHDEASATLAEAEELLAAGPDLGTLRTQAAELRRELGGTKPDESWGHLTPAELRLLPLLTTHLSFRELAEVLHISRNTVKTQAICVYRKLGVSSRSAAIERASELGLVEKPDILEPPKTAR